MRSSSPVRGGEPTNASNDEGNHKTNIAADTCLLDAKNDKPWPYGIDAMDDDGTHAKANVLPSPSNTQPAARYWLNVTRLVVKR